jgi:cell division topological specificity factor
MKWLKELFQPRTQSACLAKERLQVIVAHERSQRQGPEFLQELQKEITAVIAKYVNIGLGDVMVDYEQKGDRSVLELNITLPDQTTIKAGTAVHQTA